MGLQSGINSLIGTAGAFAALTDLNSSAKSTANTVKELGVDSKMALKAQKELQQKLDAIYANKEHLKIARARLAQLMTEDEGAAQFMNELNTKVKTPKRG